MDSLSSYRNVIFISLAAVLAAGVAFFVAERREEPEAFEITSAADAAGPIQVHVAGAVATAGVYELPSGSRAIDALDAAGGPAPEANLEAINLAVRLQDEDQVIVPRAGQPVSQVAGAGAEAVNINAATAAELDALPGIGEVYSQRIVDSRERDGPFASPDDLLARELIPNATFEGIRELITTAP